MAAVTEGLDGTRRADVTSTTGAGRARRQRASTTVVDVVEHTDPGSAWAWGTEPKLRWLRWHLGHSLRWRRVFGVQLADLRRQPGGFHAERDAERHRQAVARGGRPRPAPRCRSDCRGCTGRRGRPAWRPGPPSCRAPRSPSASCDVCGRRCSSSADRPTRPSGSLEAVEGVADLDVDRLVEDARSEVVAVLAERDWSEARRPRAEVVGLQEPGPCPGAAAPDGDHLRYEFPTLVFEGPEGSVVVPGWRPLSTYVAAIDRVAPGVALGSGVPLDADAALRHFRSLTRPELVLLTGRDEAPTEAHEVATATGPLWLLPSEAAARGWDVGPCGPWAAPRAASSITAGHDGLAPSRPELGDAVRRTDTGPLSRSTQLPLGGLHSTHCPVYQWINITTRRGDLPCSRDDHSSLSPSAALWR